MNQNIGTLSVAITGNTAGLVSAMNKATAAVQQFQGKVASGLDRLNTTLDKNIGSIGSQFKAMGAAMAGAAIAYGSFATVARAFETADSLSSISTSLGITVEQLQRLQAAAMESGGSAEGMSKALQKMSLFIAEAQEKGSGAAEALERMGISAAALKEAGTEQAFYQMVDALNSMGNAQDRLALSQQVFGQEARRMGEIIATGSDGIRAAGEAAEKTGRILSAFQVEAIKESGDEIARLKQQLDTMSAKGVAAAAADLTLLAGEARKAMSDLDSMGTVLGVVGKALAFVGAVAIDMAKTVEIALTVLRGVGNFAGAAIAHVLELFGTAADAAANAFMPAVRAAYQLWRMFIEAIGVGVAAVVKAFGTLATTLAGNIRAVAENYNALGLAGGEAFANAALEAENWAMEVKRLGDSMVTQGIKDLSAATEEYVVQAQAAGRAMANAEAPKWMTELKQSYIDANSELETYFNKITSESAVVNLMKQWFGVIDAQKEAAATVPAAPAAAGGAKKTGPLVSTDEEIKRVEDLSAAWAKMLGEVERYRMQSVGAWDPVAQEEAEYRERLSALESFNAEVIGKEQQKQDAIRQLTEAHVARLAEMEIAHEQESLKRQMDAGLIGYDQWDAAYQRMAELDAANYEAKVKRINEQYEAGLLTDEQAFRAQEEAYLAHEEAKSRFAEEHGQRRIQTEQAVMSMAANVLGQAAGLMDKTNKKQFYAWKAFASSQAIINAFLAYGQVLATPLPDFFGAYRQTMANITLGLGLASAAKIASTPYGGGGAGGGSLGGGGGGGGGNVGAGAARDASMAGSASNVNVTLMGDSFGQAQVRGLIGAINEAAGDNMNLKVQVAG